MNPWVFLKLATFSPEIEQNNIPKNDKMISIHHQKAFLFLESNIDIPYMELYGLDSF